MKYTGQVPKRIVEISGPQHITCTLSVAKLLATKVVFLAWKLKAAQQPFPATTAQISGKLTQTPFLTLNPKTLDPKP